jgi:putative endonuclease
MLRCSDNSLYSGQTNNLERRLLEHNSGKVRSAKYTKAHRPVKLVYFEKFSTLQEAMKREREIKKWTKAEKEELVNTFNCQL